MFGTYGVAAPDYYRVRRPAITGFGPDLLFYLQKLGFVYVAELRSLVLDA